TLSGRVSFLPLEPTLGHRQAGDIDRFFESLEPGCWPTPSSSNGTPTHPGIVARADQLVSCDRPDLSGLPLRLLGTTLIVQDLATAWAVSIQASGYRFVTLRGEILEPDGTLTIGNQQIGAGILSRKAELQDLRAESLTLENRVSDARSSLKAL